MSEHFFISYSSVDGADFALLLAEQLTAGRPPIPVWIDKHDLRPGRDWDIQIEEAIKICKGVIFIMSSDSVRPDSVCKNEWVFGLRYKKPIIPLRLSPDAALPFLLGSRHYLGVSGSFDAAVDQLRKHLAWIDSPEGQLQALKDRLADAERELPRAQPDQQSHIREDMAALQQQIAALQQQIERQAAVPPMIVTSFGQLNDTSIREVTEAALQCEFARTFKGVEDVQRQLSFSNSNILAGTIHDSVANLILTCNNTARGFEELIDVLWSMEHRRKPLENLLQILQSYIFLSVDWTIMAQLRAFLRLSPITDESAQAAYAVILPGRTMPNGRKQGLLYLYAVDELARHSTPPPGIDLARFLFQCRPSIFTEAPSGRLKDWVNRMQAALDATPPKREIINNPILTVKLEPSTESQNAYILDHWLYINEEDTSPQKVPFEQDKREGDCSVEELEDWVFSLLQGIYDALNEHPRLMIEILAPFELLSHCFDQWKCPIGSGTQVLGAHCEVVVRSFDRLYTPGWELFERQWEENWDKLLAHELLAQDTDINMAIFCTKTVDVYEPITKFSDAMRSHLCFLGVVLPKEPSVLIQSLKVVMDVGTPVALWLRSCTDPEGIERQLMTFVRTYSWKQWRQSIRTSRFEAGHLDPLWTNVTLLWDDPTRKPPRKTGTKQHTR